MKDKKELSKQDQEVILKIKELIPTAPHFWASAIAGKMKKSDDSIYAYVRGDKGIRRGHHKEVLKQLKKLIEDETDRTKDLLK